MTKSKIFFYFCLFFILGVFFRSIIVIPKSLGLFFLILAIIIISVFWSKKPEKEFNKEIVLAGFFLLFFFFGIWRQEMFDATIENDFLTKNNNLGRIVSLEGTISKEPEVLAKKTRLIIKPEEFDGKTIKSKGFILATISANRFWQYGDKVNFLGELKFPPNFKDFNYKDYLKTRKIYSVSYYSKITLLKRGKYHNIASFCFAKILRFKEKMGEVIDNNLLPPKNFILKAMVLGDKKLLPKSLKEELNISGLRHITAVSGMHIVILSSILMSLLLFLGFWRGQAFYFSIIFIFFFIIMTGAQASGIRAGIMGSFFLLGEKVGRKSVSSRAILIAASLMLFFNPLLLLNDAGFQLSFLAVIGIIYLAPVLRNKIKFYIIQVLPKGKGKLEKNKAFLLLVDILAMTFSAQIFTFPFLVYNFGRISLVAPVTNLLIIPIIYWIMAFGFFFSLVGIIFPFWGFIFSFPCSFLLSYLVGVIKFFSKPWAVKSFSGLGWFWLYLFYFTTGIIVWRLDKKAKLEFLDY